ncbi:glycoside hydrolase family 3 protein [Penicillium antarcticum]|uniref:glycoside hydrolase family 3 protein n=1 Tax=Penicillium antarcticum TaxID=416450 RepID=UPI0023A2BB0D|nr:glycoside hydrolase family 3 protein [Penicillium antarcticum]KAJ5295904.1 glycoside hydrolase family 3 protein [Penicillium antarcticum]
MVSFWSVPVLWLASTGAAPGDSKSVEPDTFYPREPDSPYSYPSPTATGIGGWDIAIVKAKREGFGAFGNDPFLIGFAGYETLIGHQAARVQAVPKQYLGYYGQQFNRTSYSSNIDYKTLHELEVGLYAEAARADASCVMSIYPYANNSQAC